MRVALVANRFPVVSETFIYNHAVGLRARGVDVTVIASRPGGDATDRPYDGPVRQVVLSSSVGQTAGRAASRVFGASGRSVALGEAARKHYGVSRRAARAFALALTFADFDVVHFEYTGLAIAYLDVIALLPSTRFVVSCRGSQERIVPLVEPERVPQLRALFEQVDRVHCVSEDLRRTCLGYGVADDRAFVNRPAIDASVFARTVPLVPRAEGPYTLISTGRLHWTKHLEDGIVAVRRLVDEGHDVHYELIGDGPDREALTFAAHDLGLADRVHLRGRQTPAELRAALERADVYLLPSVSEGISNAALEAMALALPVVSSDAGGMSEAITDDVDGLIVPRRSPEALADAVETLLESPALRQQLGEAARARVTQAFSIDRQIAAFVAEYEALVDAPARRAR